jgi:hypothetical protein
MGRVIKIQLDDNQRRELENGYRNGNSHSFRINCHLVLLKSARAKIKRDRFFSWHYPTKSKSLAVAL